MVQSRLLAFIIDHLILSIVLMPIVLIVNFDSFFYPTAENASRPFETFYPILIAWLIVFYMKDFIGGRSIGKRIIRIGVRDYSDAQNTWYNETLSSELIFLCCGQLSLFYYF